MASGRDMVWVAGKPIRHGSLSNAAPARPKCRPSPKLGVPSSQQGQNEPQLIPSEELIASEHLTKNMTFSHLCQEDKDKIGALIRRLLSLKAEYAQEADNAKKDKLKFNEQLQSLQQRNHKIQHQTNELKNHFSSSLALLKIYKEKVHRQECDKAEQDKKISELTTELENVKQELEKLRESQSSAQSIRRPSPVNVRQDRESELAMNATDSVAERLAQENQKLQRLLEIQNSSRAVLELSMKAKRCSSDRTHPVLLENPSEDRDSPRHPCKHCEYDSNTAPVSAPVDERPSSPDSIDETHHAVANDEDASDDEQALIKELNSHRRHVETLLYMHNDASLLEALERITVGSPDDDIPDRLEYQTDSDDEQLLKALTSDLNRRPPQNRRSDHFGDGLLGIDQ